MVTMTTMLVSVAELSNIFSVFAVLLCFCVMILFITRNMLILRMNGDDIIFPNNMHHHHPVSPRIPQMKMMKVHIPFTFKLIDSSKSTYSEINCMISSQVRYTLRVCWGVSIRELHVALWQPWSVLQEAVQSANLLDSYSQQIGMHQENNPHCDRAIKLSLPSTPSLQLGTPPRMAYPLVIFLMRVDQPECLHPDETVALVNVVHIKDSVCTLPTSILAQYLKQANGQLSCLKQLYLATGNNVNFDEELQVATAVDPQAGLTQAEPTLDDSIESPTSTTSLHHSTLLCSQSSSTCSKFSGGSSSSSSTSTTTTSNSDNNDLSNTNAVWNANGEQLCVVCQYFPLSRALLPCRHTCICASCFIKLDRCPMCRSPIKSYFCIRGEEYMSTNTNNSLNTNTNRPKGLEPGAPLFNWFDSLNDRITDFLGFGR